MEREMMQLIRERHSVRQYQQRPIEGEVKEKLLACLEELSAASGLEFRLEENAEKVFGGVLLKFAGWKRPPTAYFSIAGERTPENEEKCGYYGEKLVLYAQSLGLNTCWVGLFKKGEVRDRSVMITIAVGYGEDSGKERRTKTADQVSKYDGQAPEWFTRGVESALLAPTAVNRQAFFLAGVGDTVSATCTNGNFSAMDLGIVKYHFEQGAGAENFRWT